MQTQHERLKRVLLTPTPYTETTHVPTNLVDVSSCRTSLSSSVVASCEDNDGGEFQLAIHLAILHIYTARDFHFGARTFLNLNGRTVTASARIPSKVLCLSVARLYLTLESMEWPSTYRSTAKSFGRDEGTWKETSYSLPSMDSIQQLCVFEAGVSVDLYSWASMNSLLTGSLILTVPEMPVGSRMVPASPETERACRQYRATRAGQLMAQRYRDARGDVRSRGGCLWSLSSTSSRDKRNTMP